VPLTDHVGVQPLLRSLPASHSPVGSNCRSGTRSRPR
jgi:hypothetical protein